MNIPWNKKVSDEELIKTYKETKSTHKTAKLVGLCFQSVHGRLQKLGIMMNGHGKKWTAADTKRLRENYLQYRNEGRLDSLAKIMGRTKYFICKKAGELMLTDQHHRRKYCAKWKYLTEEELRPMLDDFAKSPMNYSQYRVKHKLPVGFHLKMLEVFPDEWDIITESKARKTSKYKIGRALEYTVRNTFRKAGYFVLRAPQSRGPADLVAIKKGEVLIINCKKSMACNPGDWNETYDLSKEIGGRAILAGNPTGGKIVIMEMTGRKKLGVRRKQPWKPMVMAAKVKR